ncbi:MAG: porin family protein [Bacteroidota bacterium]|jgi:hypothetical protein
MIKTLTWFIVFASLPFFTSAQDTQEPHKLRIGFQFTPEVTWLKSKSINLENRRSMIGFNFGPVFDYNFGSNYAITTGVIISRSRGSLFYEDSTKFNSRPDHLYSSALTVDYNLQYIELPIALRLKTNEIGYVTYFGVFGIVPAVNISAKGEFDDPTTPNARYIPESFSKDVSLPNLSMLISAGAAYSISTNTSAFLSLNFYNGLIDVTDNPKNYKTKAVLNRLGLTAGIMF